MQRRADVPWRAIRLLILFGIVVFLLLWMNPSGSREGGELQRRDAGEIAREEEEDDGSTSSYEVDGGFLMTLLLIAFLTMLNAFIEAYFTPSNKFLCYTVPFCFLLPKLNLTADTCLFRVEMYGFSNVYLRSSESDSIQRAVSVPAMLAKQEPVPRAKKAKSFSHHDSSSLFGKDKEELSFKDYLLPKAIQEELPSAALFEKGSSIIPILVTLLVGQGALLFGIQIAFSSPISTRMMQVLGVNKDSIGLLWSWVNVGAMLGCLSAAPVANRLGRKLAIICSTIPFFLGGFMFYFVENYAVISISRFITGVGVGLMSVMVPLYIAETAPTHLRGALGSVNQFMICFGIALVNAIGLPIVENPDWWKVMIILTGIPLLVVLAGLLIVGRETPFWLVSRGREEDAEKSLRFLRGDDYNINYEMNELIQNVSKHDQDEETDAVNSKAKFNKWSLLVGPALRPLLLGISLQLLQQWSGINAVMFHTTELFVNNASGEYTKEELKGAIDGAIYVNLVQVVMCLVTVLSMNKAGRRFFLILSHTGMGLAGTVMGFAYTYNWSTTARMIIIMIYLGFFALGVGPIPWLVCSEIYPSAVREIAMSISTLVNWLSAFAVTAALSPMQNAIGSDGVFWFFSVVSFGGSLLIYCTLPETKDKSLEEIEAYFLGDLDD